MTTSARVEPSHCPACGVSLKGLPIPIHDRDFFGGATHFRREIGVEVRGTYDEIDHWLCPDCGTKFNRNWEQLPEDY